VTLPLAINLGFAFKIIMVELTRSDSNERAETLERVQNLIKELSEKGIDYTEDSLEKGNYHSDSVELNKISDSKEKLQKVNELTDELKNVRIEVKDLNEFRETKIKLKKINDILNRSMSTEGVESKEVVSAMKNLKKIKQLIINIKQVEDFTKELKEAVNFIKEVNRLVEQIDKEVLKNELNGEINKANALKDNLKGKDLKKVKKLIKKLKEINIEEFIKESSNVNDLVKELNEIREVLKEAKKLRDLIDANIKEHIVEKNETFNKLIEELKDVISFMELILGELSLNDSVKYVENIRIKESKGKCECCGYIWKEIKKSKIIDKVKEKFVKLRRLIGDQSETEEKYQKLSKRLNGSIRNKIFTVIIAILAGADILYLELLGPVLKIRNFNDERKPFWGNILFDLFKIILQVRKFFSFFFFFISIFFLN
jgi:hypothetical protein